MFKYLKLSRIKNYISKHFKLSIVTKYVLKEFLITFLISFLFFFVIFFINQILLTIKPLLEKNIPFYLVATIMITSFPMIILFSLPFGTMLATLMTMGRFSSDNEIVAFRALGFNLMRIFGPIFICGVIITIITFIVNDKLVPISYHQQRITMRKIIQIKPTLDFKSKTIKKHDERIIFTNIVNDTDIQGLFIIDKDENSEKRIITAKNAQILPNKKRKGVIQLKMNDAMIQFENKDRPNEFNFGYSDSISYLFILQEFDDSDPANISGKYKSTLQNLNDVKKYKKIYLKDKKNSDNKLITLKEDTKNIQFMNEQYIKDNISYNMYIENIKKIDSNTSSLLKLQSEKILNSGLKISLIDFYNKFANPLACIIFAIFAAPIGIYTRRAGYQIGFIIGLFLTAFYWFSFYGSIVLGHMDIFKPFIAVLLPNMFFLIIGAFFLIKRLKE